MQTRRRRLFAVLAALSVAVALISGCTFSSSKSGGPLPDAAKLVKQSADTTKTVKSAHMELTVTGKVAGLPVKKLTADLTTNPNTAASGHASLTGVMGGDLEADFVVLDGELYTTALSNGSQWDDVGKAVDLVHYDPSTLLNPDVGLANLLAQLTNPKAEGRENVGGQSTIRISGTVPADAVNKLAPPFKASDPVPAVVWIQESGDHQLVQASLQKSPGNSVQILMSKWNTPFQINKPAVGG